MKKKILVVGGTGFLGYHFCKLCVKKKFDITSLSLNKPKKKRKLKIKYIICDISKKSEIIKVLKKNYDYVINFGGHVNHYEKIKTFKTHYNGTKYLSDFFLNSKIKSFIQIGSCVEYGFKNSPQKEENINYKQKLKSVYGKAKLLGSEYLLDLNKKYNFPVKIFNLYLVYGPRQDQNRLIPITINSCLSGKKFHCSSGDQMRDFLYVDDLIHALYKSLDNTNIIGKTINLGYGKPYKVKYVINLIKKKINLGKPIFGKIKLRKDEIKFLFPDIKKAKKYLNWKPKISLKKGIEETINDYKKQRSFVSK